MEELKLNYIPLYTLGYLHTKIPTSILNSLNGQVSNIIKNNFSNLKPVNEELYGAIEKEFLLPSVDKLSPFILDLCKYFWLFEYNTINSEKKHKLERVWINFQKKYEHNPMHNHGSDLSFVIWLKIPYSLEEEKSIANVKNSNNFHNETTNFSFVYSTPHSKENWMGVSKHIIEMSKEREGEIVMFKSSLPHQVYPFYTSNDFRISIAGNIVIENDS